MHSLSLPPSTHASPAPTRHFPPLLARLSSKYLLCLMLVITADIFFYGQPTGINTGLFCLLLLACSSAFNRPLASSRLHRFGYLLAVTLCFALMETPSSLPLILYSITLLACLLYPKLAGKANAPRLFASLALRYSLTSSCRLLCDIASANHVAKQRKHLQKHRLFFTLLVPVLLGASFTALFASANPIFAALLKPLLFFPAREVFDLARVCYWLGCAFLFWAILRPRFSSRQLRTSSPKTHRFLMFHHLFLNQSSVFISLLICNSLFLVQNGLDISFLWQQHTIPAGISFATYAQSGAYSLLESALLVGAFILFAMQSGGSTERHLPSLVLLTLWVGQTIFLLASAILRLSLYIQAYSLTYWRLSAVLWMVLIAVGLLLILARVFLHKDNAWLLRHNLQILYATLYLCCFINLGGLIAEYNVRHCNEVTGQGARLDTYYLQSSIGEAAIPALIWFERHHSTHPRIGDIYRARENLQQRLVKYNANWRSKSLLRMRLQWALHNAPEYPAHLSGLYQRNHQ